MSRVSHGLSRVMSRVALENRPVFVGLSRCHGSSRGAWERRGAVLVVRSVA